MSLWSLHELVCLRTFARLEWPVRTLSFSCDGAHLAAGSEDPVIDITEVSTGKQAHVIQCHAAINTLAGHPTRAVLAYAGDHKDKMGRDEGSLHLFGAWSSPS